MEKTMTWFAFVGAWLLFAGPVLQAVLDLREENSDQARIRAAEPELERPDEVSRWWWLLPPVRLLLEKRRHDAYREAYLASLSPEDRTVMYRYLNTATAWLYVAGGGFLLALRETSEVVHQHDWPEVWFYVLAVVATLLAVANTAARVHAEADPLGNKRRRP